MRPPVTYTAIHRLPLISSRSYTTRLAHRSTRTSITTSSYPASFLLNSAPTVPIRNMSSALAATNPTPLPPQPQKVLFVRSPIPKNPLGEEGYIKSAAALIIGDEILNGKTHDRNSHVFAQYCFEHGIDLKKIEVVADDEDEIIEASRRLVEKYDLVVTSGGIGPTHDDITYQSLAKSFNQPLEYHDETVRRLTEMTKDRPWVKQQNDEQRTATKRMALLPAGDLVEPLFVGEDTWVPVVRIKGKLCVLPGVPGLFQKLLHLLTPYLPLPPKSQRPLRIQVFTERPESLIAPYLTSLQLRLKPHGIQIGSYPILGQGVFVSLIGRDLPTPAVDKCNGTMTATVTTTTASTDQVHSPTTRRRLWLAEVAREVEVEVGGKVVSEEEVALKRTRSLSNLNRNASQGNSMATATSASASASAKGVEDGAKAKI